MAKFEKRLQAHRLRKNGLSIGSIAKKLAVSKSTVSLWCRGLALTAQQSQRLRDRVIRAGLKGRVMGAEVNRRKRLEAVKNGQVTGRTMLGNLSKRDLIVLGTALYWAEGSKSDRTSGFQFINSEPAMIMLIKKFLNEVMEINDAELVCSIQINQIHKKRIKLVLNFWRELLNLRSTQIRKPYFVKTKVKKVYDNYNSYYGVCRLIVRKSAVLKYKMLGLIDTLKNDILPT